MRLMPATVASDSDMSWNVLCGGSFRLSLHRWQAHHPRSALLP